MCICKWHQTASRADTNWLKAEVTTDTFRLEADSLATETETNDNVVVATAASYILLHYNPEVKIHFKCISGGK